MSNSMTKRVSMRVGARREAALSLLVGLWWTSACISDVQIPECVRHHSCGSGGTSNAAAGGEAAPSGGGAAGEGERAPAGAGGDAGGSNGRGGTADAAGAGAGGRAGDGGGAQAGANPSGASGTGGAGGTTCERCLILPAELTAPCAGKPYSASLRVSGGVAPYEWQLTPAPPGWTIAVDPQESARAVLAVDAAATDTTTLTVRAIDSRGLDVRVEYSTTARNSCWFAYTARDADGPKLALLDPLAETAKPVGLQHNVDVFDFQFSPDGRYLVYRYGASLTTPHGGHLALVDLSTLDERALPLLEDAVTAYAWSQDASALAVGFVASGQKKLGGVRLPLPGSHDSPTVLAAAPAFVEDNLQWVGNQAVAYIATRPSGAVGDAPELAPYWSALGPTGFADSQATIDFFDTGAFLQPAESGFWMIAADTFFYPMTGSPDDSVPHIRTSLVAPNKKHSARLSHGVLQVFAAADGTADPPVASAQPGACPMPLAWSLQDRIACVADVENGSGPDTHGEVRFFDLNGSDTLTASTLGGFCSDDISVNSAASCTARQQGYGYGIGEATAAPRGFSPSGRWFAFTRGAEQGASIYWADLQADGPTLTGSLFLGQYGPASRLAFSPDSRKIAFQTGVRLFIKTLSGDSPEMLTNTPLTPLDDCIEELPTAPDRYCGNTALDAPFKWAPDSKALAYRESGAVTVVDTSHASELVEFPLPAPTCEAPTCSGGFEFQPTVSP